ncbi:hypothetical protein [Tellurirhabdus rosea]|uniref:hypothetical protein n=1 Tax=Tellurirhabdus rosea TaxID=2674997 RepID=UPI0022599348|nr:hypothetical protein [Tellurirhabdus rosea]
MRKLKNPRQLLYFGFIWACLGFTLGCFTLLGPVRWIVTFARDNDFSESTENWLVRLAMLLFFFISFRMATRAVRRAEESRGPRLKWGIPAGALAAAVLSLALFLNPEFLNGTTGGSLDTSNEAFTFGPYPTPQMLGELKKEGYAGVISLLHPAVTPFEPMLLEEEKKAGKQVGLDIISIPMLPWVSQNEASIKQIRDLAAKPKGRYYVHCYLGKDRVNVVKRIIAGSGGTMVNADGGVVARSLSEIDHFERGPVVVLGNDVYLTPFPTDEEYLGYLMAAGVKQVVCAMDGSDSEAKKRIQQEGALLQTYQIAYRHLPVVDENDEQAIHELLTAVRGLPKPLVIHRFFSDRATEKKIAEAYWKKYGKPAF